LESNNRKHKYAHMWCMKNPKFSTNYNTLSAWGILLLDIYWPIWRNYA
jgi:hypothetical protein